LKTARGLPITVVGSLFINRSGVGGMSSSQ
jgi:hypothetical protein